MFHAAVLGSRMVRRSGASDGDVTGSIPSADPGMSLGR